MKLKYDFYESNLDGSEEKRLSKLQLLEIISFSDLLDMVDIDEPEIIIKNNKKYWAEEAMNYQLGYEA